jgi:MEDS: MEthanogen/methylotroph, DcmR Sensory domain
MPKEAIELGFGGESMPIGSHVCWYYSGEEQLRETLGFLRLGLQRRDNFCVLFADHSRFEVLLQWLGSDMDEDPGGFLDRGQLVLIGGAPTTPELLAKIGARLDVAVALGYQVIRFLGFIAWGAPGWPDDEALLDFESQVNGVVTSYPAVIVCTYDVPILPGPTLIYGGLRSHPVAVLDGRVVRR